MSTSHGDTACGHTYQRVDAHEAGNTHGHEVLQRNDDNQQQKHDD